MMIEQLFLQILNMSLMASYCIAAVFLLRWLFKKAPKRYTYLLWLVVAFRLVCPLSIDSAFSIFNLDLMPEIAVEEFAGQGGAQSDEDVNVPGDEDFELSNRPGEAGNGVQNDAANQSGANQGTYNDTANQPGANQGAYNDTANQPGANQGTYNEAINQQGTGVSGITGLPGDINAGEPSAVNGSARISLTVIGSWLWIGGMAALAGLMLISWIRLKLHIRTAVRVRDNIYEADGIESPFVMGSFRTKIYLPAGLTAEQQELILLHENCHIRRKDHLVKMLASLLTIVYWFNPLVWVAWFGFCRDMEMSCDEMALAGADGELRKAYSQTLLAVAVQKPFGWQMPPAFGENSVKSRIKHVLSFKKPAIWVGGAFVVVLVLVWVIFGTNGQGSVPDETLPGTETEESGELNTEESEESGELGNEESEEGGELKNGESEVNGESETEGATGQQIQATEIVAERFDYGRKDIASIHAADIDHDGSDEDIVVFNAPGNGNSSAEVFVVKNSEVVWKRSLSIAAYCTGLFLQAEGGEDYLVGYDSDDGYTYRYFQFSLTANENAGWAGQQRMKEELGKYDILTVNLQRYDSFPLDTQRIGSYVDGANELLGQSTVLYLNKTWTPKTEENEVGAYIEELSELFVPAAAYQDCGTLQEKLELLSETKLNQFLPDGQMPDMLKNLSSTMPDRLAPYMDQTEDSYAKIDEHRADLFEDYNGDKLQIVQKETDSGGTSVVYYYRADEGETAADVAKRLVEIMYEAKTVPTIGAGSMVVTDYLIADQTLREGNFNIEAISGAIIQEYCAGRKKLTLKNDQALNDWIDLWLSQNYGQSTSREINPLPEDMWLFIPEGYYRFVGAELVSFEGAMSVDTECVDGMIPFIYQGGDGVFEYLLVKYGDVYRLQRNMEMQWESVLTGDADASSQESESETYIGWNEAAIQIPQELSIIRDGEPIILENQEELQRFGEQAGLTNTIPWNLLVDTYANSWNDDKAIILVSRTDEASGYEYGAKAGLDEASGELTLEITRYLHEDTEQSQREVRQLLVLFAAREQLKAVSGIRTELTDVKYSDEDLQKWYYVSDGGIGDRTLAVHDADLDHDGVNEQIELYYTGGNYQRMTVGVFKDSELIWYKTYLIYSDGGYQGVFLYRKDGKDYLLEYNTGVLAFGKYFTESNCYYLDEDGTLLLDRTGGIELELVFYEPDQFPLSPDDTQAYVERLNGMLTDSICIWGNLTRKLYWAPSDTTPEDYRYYLEDLSLLFENRGDYSGCETVAEKIEVFNEYMQSQLFENGQLPQ